MVKELRRQRRKYWVIAAIFIFVILLLLSLLAVKPLFSRYEPGWHTDDHIGAFYVDADGNKVTGYHMIADKPYYFLENGSAAQTGWITHISTDDGESTDDFYCLGNGELATGWRYTDGKVIYFFQTDDINAKKPVGAWAKDYTTSGGLQIPSSGYFDGEEGLALAYGIDVLNRYGWDLTSAYKYSSSLRFVRDKDEEYGLTIHSTALHGFKYGAGNCLAWSGTFCVMAKLLGYDCRQIWGTLQWKGIRPHAWTEIWVNRTPHVYDPRKHDGEDMAGFDVQYGDKGSYKYDLESREYLNW